MATVSSRTQSIRATAHIYSKHMYKEVYAYMQVQGYRPRLHKLDNKTSRDVEDFITEQQAKIQYTPADIVRRNRGDNRFTVMVL